MLRFTLLAATVQAANKRVAQGAPSSQSCTESGADDGLTYGSTLHWYAGKTNTGDVCRPTCVDETETYHAVCCSLTVPGTNPGDYEQNTCSDPVIGISNQAIHVAWATGSSTCAGKMNYAAAKAHCASAGTRLCTEQEAWNMGCTASTTCASQGGEFMWVESDTDGGNGKICDSYSVGGQVDRDSAQGTSGRTGVSSADSLAAPSAIEGQAFQKDLNTIENAGGSYTPGDSNVLGKNSTDAGACSAQGFLCDFSQYAKLGVYKPADFTWKIIDPTDYGQHGYEQQTLNCKIDITLGSDAANGGPKATDYFYVPIGQENVGSTDYCDVEAIRRTVNNDALNMTDMIRVRGETSRVNNAGGASRDLVGEQFDLVCKCTTVLSTEASLEAKQADLALLTVITSTGQSRELGVFLEVYGDSALLNSDKVTYPATFPDNKQSIYFMARHQYDNDWDVKLQINACVVCDLADSCTTTADSDSAVFFYDDCSTLLGGPQQRPVSGWYVESDSNALAIANNVEWLQGRPIWADKDPYTCPYAVLGMQKFRITGFNVMQITCQVTGCDTLPCKPCRQGDTPSRTPAARRKRALSEMMHPRQRSANRRSLQNGGIGNVDVSTNLRLSPADSTNGEGEYRYGEPATKKSSAPSTVSIILIVLFLLILAGSLFAVRYVMNKRAEEQERAQKVRPADGEK